MAEPSREKVLLQDVDVSLPNLWWVHREDLKW